MVAEYLDEGGTQPPSFTLNEHDLQLLEFEHAQQSRNIVAEVRELLLTVDLERQRQRKKPNDYKYMSAHKLRSEKEYWQWSKAEYECRQRDTPEVDWTFELYQANTNLELIERAMQRLANIKEDSGASPSLAPDPYADIDFAAIKSRIRIDDFITRIAMTHPVGRSVTRYKICCPLPGHDDSTPSMTVYMDTETCKCFGCGRGGDVVSTARHYFEADNNGASAHLLCKYMGIEVPHIHVRRVMPTASVPGQSSSVSGPGDSVISIAARRLARGRRRAY